MNLLKQKTREDCLRGDWFTKPSVKFATSRVFENLSSIFAAPSSLLNSSWLCDSFLFWFLYPQLGLQSYYQEKMPQGFLVRNKVFGKYAFQETNTSRMYMVKNIHFKASRLPQRTKQRNFLPYGLIFSWSLVFLPVPLAHSVLEKIDKILNLHAFLKNGKGWLLLLAHLDINFCTS